MTKEIIQKIVFATIILVSIPGWCKEPEIKKVNVEKPDKKVVLKDTLIEIEGNFTISTWSKRPETKEIEFEAAVEIGYEVEISFDSPFDDDDDVETKKVFNVVKSIDVKASKLFEKDSIGVTEHSLKFEKEKVEANPHWIEEKIYIVRAEKSSLRGQSGSFYVASMDGPSNPLLDFLLWVLGWSW